MAARIENENRSYRIYIKKATSYKIFIASFVLEFTSVV
jgi:hypothetical protein